MSRKSHASSPKRRPVSAAQLAANQANAQASTGPRTEEGKARSSQNAVKHGLYSRRSMERLAGKENAEARAEYDAHLAGLQASWQPQGEQEETLVDNMADQGLRLADLRRARDVYLDKQRAKYDMAAHAFDAELLKTAQPFFAEEARLERSVNSLLRHLLHLRRWRTGTSKPALPDLSAFFFPPRPVLPPEEPPVQPDPVEVSEFADEPASDSDVPFPPADGIDVSDQPSMEEVGKQSQRVGNYVNGVWIDPPEAT
jgi:hypothetical protein